LSNPFIGEGGLGVAVSPDGSRAFVGHHNFSRVSVCNTGIQNPVPSRREFSRLADIPVSGRPLGVASQDRNKVYVADASGTLSVITATDAVTYKLTATLPIGCDPRGVAVSPDGSKVYVTNQGSDEVSVIATATSTVIPTGTSLTGLDRPVSFGAFIGPAPSRFIGAPGFSNCVGQSIAAVDQKFGDRNSAAADLRFPDARALENAIVAFCQ
jgi:YVTN family beta-propeller protein